MSNQEIPRLEVSSAVQVPAHGVRNQRRPVGKVTGREIRTGLIASTGFFMDAYDIFVISLAVPMLGYVH